MGSEVKKDEWKHRYFSSPCFRTSQLLVAAIIQGKHFSE